MGKFTKEDIIRRVMEEDIQFIRMQFTDIFGQMKNVAITASQIEKAVNNQIMMDGSSIEGFVRSPHLRRPQSQRHAVCGRSAERAQAGAAQGKRHGLHVQRRSGTGVFPLPDG